MVKRLLRNREFFLKLKAKSWLGATKAADLPPLNDVQGQDHVLPCHRSNVPRHRDECEDKLSRFWPEV